MSYRTEPVYNSSHSNFLAIFNKRKAIATAIVIDRM